MVFSRIVGRTGAEHFPTLEGRCGPGRNRLRVPRKSPASGIAMRAANPARVRTVPSGRAGQPRRRSYRRPIISLAGGQRLGYYIDVSKSWSRKPVEMVGRRFGALTVLRRAESKSLHVRWRCACDCGGEKDVLGFYLRNGQTQSCGCGVVGPKANFHNRSKHPLYMTQQGMISRCERPWNVGYKDYGGRGIKVCDDWHDIEKFIAWGEANGWKPGLTIERKDVNGDYCPENCCWIPRSRQTSNTRRTVWFEVDGKRMTMAEAARAKGLLRATVQLRLKSGWSKEQALQPVQRKDNCQLP